MARAWVQEVGVQAGGQRRPSTASPDALQPVVRASVAPGAIVGVDERLRREEVGHEVRIGGTGAVLRRTGAEGLEDVDIDLVVTQRFADRARLVVDAVQGDVAIVDGVLARDFAQVDVGDGRPGERRTRKGCSDCKTEHRACQQDAADVREPSLM